MTKFAAKKLAYIIFHFMLEKLIQNTSWVKELGRRNSLHQCIQVHLTNDISLLP